MRTGVGLVGGLLALAVLAALPAPASAKTIVTHSPDSLAPKHAPAHWLPPEPWVYNHWLPFDESRLYRLLRIDREQLWLQLRDDGHTVAQLAAHRGYRDPHALAERLVAPRAGTVGEQQRRILVERAERTLTQGHLAQHVFFHSLHQFAIPSAAPDIFRVTDARFRALRRAELSPLAIARLHGRFPGQVEAMAIDVLRDRIRAGVSAADMTAAQGRLLLGRQLSQLPRWLDQQRYNGPPLTHRGALLAIPKDYASNPSISADGRFVAYEAYRQKLPLAVRLGEIAVLRADLQTGRSTLVSAVRHANARGFQPQSSYNPSISSDGARVTYETSAGNQNFAKRYGRIGALLCDLTSRGRPAAEVDRRPSAPPLADSQSAYNPVVSGDGSSVAYQAVRGGRTRILIRRGASLRAVVSGSAVGRSSFSDAYEPGLSADGKRLVFTLASGRVGVARSATSAVLVRDLTSGVTLVASRADGSNGARATGASADGAISPDGTVVAFTSTARGLGVEPGRVGLFLRDLRAGRTVRIPVAHGRPLDPVLALGGSAVAFAVEADGHSTVRMWRRTTGAVELVSRAGGRAGVRADGRSDDPSISSDGTRIAFSSTATNLVRARSAGPRAIYVRDVVAKTTTRVSDTARAYPGSG